MPPLLIERPSRANLRHWPYSSWVESATHSSSYCRAEGQVNRWRSAQRLSAVALGALTATCGARGTASRFSNVLRRSGGSCKKGNAIEPESPTETALTGLESWRAQPAEDEHMLAQAPWSEAVNDRYNLGLLERCLPIRSMAVLRIPPENVPCVGQERFFNLDPKEEAHAGVLAAIRYASAWDCGVACCIPRFEGSLALPWGGTAVEVQTQHGNSNHALVALKGVCSVRLVGQHPRRWAKDFSVACAQEAREWGTRELVQIVEDLYNECAELQRRSGYTAVGDFTSVTLSERTEAALGVLKDARILDIEGAELSPRARRAMMVVHAFAASLSTQVRAHGIGKGAEENFGFMCHPRPVLHRLKDANHLLTKVKSVLGARLALRRAMEDDDGAADS